VLSFSFTNMVESSTVIPQAQQQHITNVLEHDAEFMSDAQLEHLVTDEPPAVQQVILDINSDARDISLQVALLVPVLAGLIGLINGLRMRRLPDIEPATDLEGLDLA
jgi:hypothetical protein